MDKRKAIDQLIERAIKEDLTIEIDYAKNSYEKSSRVISDLSMRTDYGVGYISAFCHMREEQRTFKISRIVDARIVSGDKGRTEKLHYNYEFDDSKPIFNLYGEKY